MAAGDLTTIDAVHAQLRLEDPIDDAWLASLISSSSAWVVAQLGWSPLSAAYSDTFDGDGGTEHVLRSVVVPRKAPVPPVTVQSVTVDGVTVTPLAAGVGWYLSDGVVRLVGSVFTVGTRNAVIAYTAGYATAPLDLAQATAEHVALRYRDRDWGAANAKIIGGDSIDHRQATSGSWAFIAGVLEDYQPLAVFG